jgi:hypothetical protein
MHLLRAEGVAHGNGTMLRIGFSGGCSDHVAAALQNHLEFEQDKWGGKKFK